VSSPIAFADDVVDLEYVGSWEMAAPQFLHRDVLNVADRFERRGLDVDAEEVFADLLSFL